MFEDLNRLLSQKDKKVLFVGIGNILRMDDGVGVYISNKLKDTRSVSALTAEVSIENYIGKINRLNPDILLLIDCADIKKSPGSFKLLPAGRIQDLTFNTHNISLRRLSEFFGMPVFILGIQPEKVDLGENISYIVQKAADRIVQFIITKEVPNGNRILM